MRPIVGDRAAHRLAGIGRRADSRAGLASRDMSGDNPLGSILSVWAHPDDETWLCAGLMARAVAAGDRVVCVTATRGELGSPDEERWPSGAPLAAVRTAEMQRALAILGVTEHHWLDYPDGGCADVDQDEAVRRVTALMAEMQPDTVLTFGPDGMTGHDDHTGRLPLGDGGVRCGGARRVGARLRDELARVAGRVPGAAGQVQRVHGRRAAVHAAGRAADPSAARGRAARDQAGGDLAR